MRPASLTLLLFMVAVAVSAQTLPEQINAILARPALSGVNWTIVIENESGSTRFYERNPGTGAAPASNTKLVTTAAAFALLGTNHVFETRVYLDGSFSGGVLTGNLNFVSEHDITWNQSVFSSSRRALDHIAARLKANGLKQIIGDVRGYGACMYNYGSTANTTDTGNQDDYNREAAAAFIAALQAQGISVSGVSRGFIGFNPPGTLFYTHKSSDLTYGGQPLRLDVACIPLNKVSHNPMADLLLRHIGYKLGGTDSFSAGRTRVFSWLQSIGISTGNTVMNDGSGLSWNNRFSANQIVALTRYMVSMYPSWATTLPIGCVDGTIGGRFCGTAGGGRVRAKTGSLSISIALSGYIDNPNDNQRYFFSFIANRQSPYVDQTATRNAIDDCVVLLGARGLSISPEILSVTNNASGNGLVVHWSDVGLNATANRLYISTDGIQFNQFVTFPSNVFSFQHNGLVPGDKRFYRVVALRGTNQTAFSRTYAAEVGQGAVPLLIVDANDRWRVYPQRNPAGTNHTFAAVTAQHISGPAFDTVHHSAISSGMVALTNYHSVIWLCGEQSTQDETFSSAEQQLVGAFLDRGGNLFVSGAEVGWDLDRDSGPTAADRSFYRNYLRATLNGNINDDASTYAFSPVPNRLFAGNSSGTFDNGTMLYDVQYPDVLTPINGSVAALNYVGGLGGAAAVTYDGSLGGGKVVNFGFPFESITNPTLRTAYMSDVLWFFGLVELPDVIEMERSLPPSPALTLRWRSSAGLLYRVQYKTDLGDAAWLNLADVNATGKISSFADNLSSGRRFYRVVLVH